MENRQTGVGGDFTAEPLGQSPLSANQTGKADTFSEPPFKSTSHNAVDNPNNKTNYTIKKINKGLKLMRNAMKMILRTFLMKHADGIGQYGAY